MSTEGDRARTLLTYANYAKVAGALHVSRAAVADWAKGMSVTPYRLHQLEQLLRPDLQTQKEAAPPWAERLEDKLDQVVANQSAVTDEAVRQLLAALASPGRVADVESIAAELRRVPPPSGEAPPDSPDTEDRDTEAPANRESA